MVSFEYELELTTGRIEFLESIQIEINEQHKKTGQFYVSLEVSYTDIENTGIGHYQYGSELCYDKGVVIITDYEVELASWMNLNEDQAEQMIDFLKGIDEKFKDKLLQLAEEDFDKNA